MKNPFVNIVNYKDKITKIFKELIYKCKIENLRKSPGIPRNFTYFLVLEIESFHYGYIWKKI